MAALFVAVRAALRVVCARCTYVSVIDSIVFKSDPQSVIFVCETRQY